MRRRDFLKAAGLTGAGLFLGSRSVEAARHPQPKRPNIVMVIADDQTWFDAGCYGNTSVRTPNMNLLAKQGTKFNYAFTATAMCAPSRMTLYTGLYPMRHGAHPNHSRVKDGTRSLPHHLKALGYEVAICEKTHFKPAECFPFNLLGRYSARTLDTFFDEQKNEPFCLIVGSHSPHVPWKKEGDYDPAKVSLPPYFADTPEIRQAMCYYYNEISEVDTQLGEVMQLLNKHSLEDNTVLIYTSDQGAQWPHAKWTLYDDGIRTPFIVRWPGIVKPGSVTNAMISFVDVVSTFIVIAGGKPVKKLDGRSFLDVLKSTSGKHREVIYATTTRDGVMNNYPGRTVRTRKYKYILNLAPDREYTSHLTKAELDKVAGRNPVQKDFWDSWKTMAKTDPKIAAFLKHDAWRPAEELYDLEQDPHELVNLAGKTELSNILCDLRAKLDNWMAAQGDKGLEAEEIPKAIPIKGEKSNERPRNSRNTDK